MGIHHIFLLPMLVLNVGAFVTTTKPMTTNFNYVGDIPPVGYFDPLGICDNVDEEMVKYIREAELQHGRVAMYSMVVLPTLDILDRKTLAIDKLASMSLEEQLPYWIGAACFECARMGAGWENPFIMKDSFFKLSDNYQPGNVLKLPNNMYTEEDMNKELANGRLAMIGSLGYIAQEFVSHHSPI